MLVKIISLALAGVFLGVILKKYSKELVVFLEIAILVAALFIISGEIKNYSDLLGELFSLYEGRELFLCIFKGSAITVLCRLASEVCRESGNGLMGEIVEIGGRVMLVILALPFVAEAAEIALAFIK